MSATQTRERIIGIIATGDSFGAAANIAGEIDAKDRRIAELEANLAEAVAKHRFCDLQLATVNTELRECQSALRLALAGTEQHYFAIPARIDDVRAALAEARAEVATLTLKLANARLNLKHCSEGVDKRDECEGQLAEARAERDECATSWALSQQQLAEARAEVERMRPAAQAWERQAESFRAHDAAVRARAAQGGV